MLDFLSGLRPLELLLLGHFSLLFLGFGVSALKLLSRRSSSHGRPFAVAAEERPRRTELPYINVASALPTENYGCQVNGINLSRSLLD
ncbi:hypothetical protein [Azospirillum sp. A29]|uniref:hypothetical protein n=1 Tax=unclassified Azospirillum TaxID=2630922 RepID=UPI00366F6192